jgi:ABC-type amino acid transport substrate-binding protein
VFNLGVRDATPPYGFKDASGQYVGFATELALAIHAAVNKELGGQIKLAMIPVTGATRLPLLQNGTIDMEAGASVATQGRARVVDFIMPHFLAATSVLVQADSPIHSFADMTGRRIGVPQGGLEEAAYRTLNARKATPAPIRTIGFPDHPQGVTALQTGAIDAYSTDEPILWGFATDRAKWRIIAIGINSFQQAFLIRPSSSGFKRIADITLAAMFSDGRWTALYDKYFGPGSATNLPITDQLQTLVLMNSWPA